MSKNSYIIGGGITGLIWNFYNPDWTIITPEVGGIFNSKNLILIHDTAETRQFLKDLGWKSLSDLEDRYKIGFYHNGWITEYQSKKMNLIAIQKKMTPWNKPIDKTFIPESRDMSTAKLGGDNYLKILQVTPEEILERIKRNSPKIKKGKVVEITNKLIETETETLEYDKLISTIPAPEFWKIYYQFPIPLFNKFYHLPVTHIEIEPQFSVFDFSFDMVYYNDEVVFSRVSKTISGTLIVEFTGIISQIEFQFLFPKVKILNYSIITYGRISGYQHSVPDKDIVFSGRFSQWDYRVTIEYVIKQVIDYKKHAQPKTHP